MSDPAGRSACLACETIRERSAPGGCIHETTHWFVDHCIGPLGPGTLIVKPKRHVVRVSDLVPEETGEMGTVLQQAAAVVTRLEVPEQVYVTLWSHADAAPGHVHFVVQPVTQATMEAHGGSYGPRLQVRMLEEGVLPDTRAAARFAERARASWPR